jgi:uncharacterized caspase-like protein
VLGSIGRLIAAFLLAAAATGAWAAPGKRVALVIGNGAYQFTAPLANPANDAGDMGAVLKRMGFEVIEGRNLDESGMRRTIKRFAEALTGADVGLFFYAGHGLQVGGHNYLVPVDARLENAAGLDFELIRLDVVHRTMERETKTNVIFLDACRDNPLSRNLARSMGTRSSQIGKGLAVVESGVGTLISFSTQPGNVALDGEGRNSPYATSLIRHIANPTEDLSTLLIQVRNEVMAATRDQQIPWEHSALRSKFYFAGAPPPPEPAAAKPPWPPPVSSAELAAQTQELRRALEEARLAREAAKAAEEQRLAALRAAEDAARQAEEAVARKREAEKARDATSMAALPKIENPQASGGFEGIWTVVWQRGPNCGTTGGGSFTVSVTLGGTVMAKGGAIGRVASTGAVTWNVPAANDGAPVRYQGTLRTTTGSGRFARVDGACAGSFTAKRN